MSNLINDPYQYGILTEIGIKKLNASTQEKQLNLTHFVLGDGQGNPVTPIPSGTSLINQIGREPITETKEGFISGGILMTPDMAQKYAGQYIREAGLIDDDGDLIVWCAYAPTQIALTTGRTLMIVMPIVADGKVNVVIDTSKKFVSFDDLNSLKNEILQFTAINDLTSKSEQLSDTNNKIYDSLPRYVTAIIPAGKMKPIIGENQYPIFSPDGTLSYTINIFTLKTNNSFQQTLGIFSSKNENLIYYRSGSNFNNISNFISLIGIPVGDLFVNGEIFTKNVTLVNL
ncbi:phage tail-collar fiber domain-containing protein [Photobacterium damselae]|uniref:phage tail-collar fiber domain-containing protein n=1 Tax=Photobacterium damselae TaxID=38293 RepID=UPI002F3FB385